MTAPNAHDAGGIIAHWADVPGTQVWTAHGLLCAITPSPMQGLNGYVRLPDAARIDVTTLDAPGGITWGPDEAGWIGFDTGHATDLWLDPEVPESPLDQLMRELPSGRRLSDMRARLATEYGEIWTLEKLREAVEALAAQVAQRFTL